MPVCTHGPKAMLARKVPFWISRRGFLKFPNRSIGRFFFPSRLIERDRANHDFLSFGKGDPRSSCDGENYKYEFRLGFFLPFSATDII